MLPAAGVLSTAAPWLGVLAIYLALGGAVGLLLRRVGRSAATGLSALLVWPILLPALKASEVVRAPSAAGGPRAERISSTFAAVSRALELGPEVPGGQAELAALRRALEVTDRRLAWVDSLLADDAGPGAEEDLAKLRAAREFAVSETDQILASVSQLRLQIGLAALTELRDGGAQAVHDRLRELRARVQVLEELGP